MQRYSMQGALSGISCLTSLLLIANYHPLHPLSQLPKHALLSVRPLPPWPAISKAEMLMMIWATGSGRISAKFVSRTASCAFSIIPVTAPCNSAVCLRKRSEFALKVTATHAEIQWDTGIFDLKIIKNEVFQDSRKPQIASVSNPTRFTGCFILVCC